MTKATSKYKRAKIRSKARSPKRAKSSRTWNLSIVAILVVGALLIAFTVKDNKSASAVSPKVGEHWHAFLGVDICGTWLSDAPEFENQAGSDTLRAGIHSHGDGIMHTHPFANGESGNNAVVGTFLEYGGWSADTNALSLWDSVKHTNEDKCSALGDKKAIVQWTTGYPNKEWSGKPLSGSPADYKYHDGEIVAIYFLPKGADLPKPPNADAALANISDIGGAAPGAGASGSSGSSGVSGASGSTGSSGATGTTGTTGASGASGATTTP